MFTEERRTEILKMLETEGRVLAKDLADRFEMSIDSIRRDLTIMEEKGLLKRTHGGAIPPSQVRNTITPESLPTRYGEGTPLQNAISKKAASYIHENDTVFISGTGIHYGMLKYLPTFPFTVVTNAIRIADCLKDLPHIDTYIVGGKVKQSGNMTDALAYDFLRQFSLDICFITGGAISKNGISTATPEVASLGRSAIEISRKTICLAPHEKLGIDAFVKIGPITPIDILITDEEASIDVIEEIESRGVKVIIAKVDSI
ncbi:DeoR family transcriptional regulator [Paenibacillus taihuensis]|uniref:DeoR family transcriptional regulator n=1 Tax=Paenibacillus taihuensis TaxID=1156355 RepID=A0A3D9RWZ6_9BACL|nr:DeoR/GlpR family DNA-binding transcription regulator [Paenibacillus taihuensis]REE81205.1 DeoR family transcriptional regulator [Paenibacillus taihuensis]